MMLNGKCALITGSTGGIGFAAATRLAAEGCDVILNGLADAEQIASRRGELESGFGVRTMYHGADLRDPARSST
jgi:3-hydroxybutyrate dehydrogenase